MNVWKKGTELTRESVICAKKMIGIGSTVRIKELGKKTVVEAEVLL